MSEMRRRQVTGTVQFVCIFVVITTISALTSKPNRNLLGIIELGAEEFVKRCVKDIVELEEGFDDELQVELDNGTVCFVDLIGNDGIRWRNDRDVGTTSPLECIAITCTAILNSRFN